MPAVEDPEAAGEGSPRRSAPEIEEVRLAPTVRRPKPSQGDGRTPLQAEAVCPPALPRNAVVTEPDLMGFRVRPQVGETHSRA
jgi:hypothetical protein